MIPAETAAAFFAEILYKKGGNSLNKGIPSAVAVSAVEILHSVKIDKEHRRCPFIVFDLYPSILCKLKEIADARKSRQVIICSSAAFNKGHACIALLIFLHITFLM